MTNIKGDGEGQRVRTEQGKADRGGRGTGYREGVPYPLRPGQIGHAFGNGADLSINDR